MKFLGYTMRKEDIEGKKNVVKHLTCVCVEMVEHGQKRMVKDQKLFI